MHLQVGVHVMNDATHQTLVEGCYVYMKSTDLEFAVCATNDYHVSKFCKVAQPLDATTCFRVVGAFLWMKPNF